MSNMTLTGQNHVKLIFLTLSGDFTELHRRGVTSIRGRTCRVPWLRCWYQKSSFLPEWSDLTMSMRFCKFILCSWCDCVKSEKLSRIFLFVKTVLHVWSSRDAIPLKLNLKKMADVPIYHGRSSEPRCSNGPSISLTQIWMVQIRRKT
jgi:hypothetical protein